MERARTSWNIMESYGTLRNMPESYRTSWNMVEHGAIFQNMGKKEGPRRFWKDMEA
jgi:hypothetical protein